MPVNLQKPNALLHHTRLLSCSDADAAIKHLHALSAHDRYLRFCGSASNAAIERLIQHSFGSKHHVFLGYNIGPLLIGVAQLAQEQSTTTEWEIALSVDTTYRRIGVASRLMKEAIDYASSSGGVALSFSTLPENKAMIALGLSHGFQVHASGQFVTGQLNLRDEASSTCPKVSLAHQVL